jgi:hypothetical protein
MKMCAHVGVGCVYVVECPSVCTLKLIHVKLNSEQSTLTFLTNISHACDV